MPIPLPSLDDHDFDGLTTEARALIPVLHPGWTDHNPSDPGIALVELLAWLTEMLLYQVNQIPEANTRKFLELLGGPQWTPPAAGGLDAAIRQTMRDLHERYRAATADDYEYLIGETWPGTPEAVGLPPVHRVRCVPGRDLTAADVTAPAPAHVSLVVVPEPSDELVTALLQFLDPRRILTVRDHVVGPSYVDIGISASLALLDDSPPEDALDDAQRRLQAYLDPLDWPFGQAVHPSEVYAVLEPSSLIDYIEDVQVSGPPVGTDGGIELDVHQLPRLSRGNLVAYDSYGRTHPRTWGTQS